MFMARVKGAGMPRGSSNATGDVNRLFTVREPAGSRYGLMVLNR